MEYFPPLILGGIALTLVGALGAGCVLLVKALARRKLAEGAAGPRRIA